MALGLVCRKGLGSTLKSIGIIDYFWEIQKGNSESYRIVQSELKNFEIHFLISAHTSVRTTLLCARIKAVKKISFAKPWNFFIFNHRVDNIKTYPESIRLLSLIKNESSELQEYFSKLNSSEDYILKQNSGRLMSPPHWADPVQGWPASGSINKTVQELTLRYKLVERKWIALFPGSVWATKMWKKEGFIELGQSLQKKGYQIIIMGGSDEKELGGAVAEAIPEALSLCGQTTLLESLALISQSQLVVGNDSSSSHMAAFVGVPVVAIFGPTVLKFGYRPWGQNSAVVELENLSCRPCGPHGHKKCPLNHHNCMKQLEAREVLRVVEMML